MPVEHESDRGRWFWPVVIAIAVLAAAQALAIVWRHDLSIDEPFMATVVADPASIPRVLPHDDVPAAYVLFVAWTKLFGNSALALRGISITAYAIACMFVAAAGRRAGGNRTGALAALLMACSAIGLAHAATARPYALVVLFAAIALWGDGRGTASVFIPHLLGLFTHPVFLFVSALSAAARFVVPDGRRSLAIPPLAAVAVYAATWSWMLMRTVALPSTSWMPRPVLRNLVSGYTHVWGLPAGTLLAALAVAAAVTLLRRRARLPGAVVRAALVAAGVMVVTFGVSQFRPVYLSLRTPVFVLPAASLALAWVFATSSLRALAPAAAAIVVVAAARSTVDAVRAGDTTPTRASIATVARDVQCGDVIVAAGMSYPPVAYYARDAGVPSCVRIVPFPADVAEHPGWPDMRPGFIQRLRDEAPSAAAALPAASRVWLFRSPGGIGLEAGVAIDDELVKRRRVERRLRLTGSFFEEVILFSPADGGA